MIPLDVAPGALFTARLEGAVPNAPFTMIAHALNPIALPGFPNGVANFTLGIGGLGVAGFVPLLDGIGVFGAPSGIAFGSSPTATAPGGLLDLVGLSTPNPPIGIGLTIQTIYLDPASPTGWRLGWASRPQNL